MFELKHIQKIYNPGLINEKSVFDDFSLSLNQGDFVSIVGSNGSGKTTLLNIICGSTHIQSGRILLDGKEITHQKEHLRYRSIGRVYQNPAVGTCPHLTILENLALADNKGHVYGLSSARKKANEEAYLSMLASLGLGLENQPNALVGSLSGGQRQALSLLMATMTPLEFLILDEHTAALDPKTADTVMEMTDRIVREKKLTALMVTHNLRYAVEYGNRLLMMDRGRIILDVAGAEKESTSVGSILGLFNSISIECGN